MAHGPTRKRPDGTMHDIRQSRHNYLGRTGVRDATQQCLRRLENFHCNRTVHPTTSSDRFVGLANASPLGGAEFQFGNFCKHGSNEPNCWISKNPEGVSGDQVKYISWDISAVSPEGSSRCVSQYERPAGKNSGRHGALTLQLGFAQQILPQSSL